MGQIRLCNRSTQMQSLEREPPSPTVPRHTVCCCVLQFLGGNAAGAWLMIAPSDPGGTPPNHISLDSVVKELERAIETGSDHALALLGELHVAERHRKVSSSTRRRRGRDRWPHRA